MAVAELHPLAKRLLGSASFAVTETLATEVNVIGTHNGTFHCDEALACGLLKLLPKYESSPILRTRNQSLLDKCAIVVDVGAKYDAEMHRFDHHQRGFETKFDEGRKTKLSSAGLVYKHYGKELIEIVAKHERVELQPDIVNKLFVKVYNNFVEHIDGIDNGVPSCDGEKNYSVTTTLSSRVGRLNPSWNNSENVDVSERFKQAVVLCLDEFVVNLTGMLHDWLPARTFVVKAVESRGQVDQSNAIMRLEQFGKLMLADDSYLSGAYDVY